MANRTIRLFVSSTFADFQAERGVLHKDVFPEISRICVPNGFEFEPIDLRWGISDEAVLEGYTTGICFDEIARCRAVSPRLNLFFLVGNRYGWRPLPEAIPHTAFDTLIPLIRGKAPETAGLFETAYRRDDNAIPPVMRLLPDSGVLHRPGSYSRMVEAMAEAADEARTHDQPWSGASLTE